MSKRSTLSASTVPSASTMLPRTPQVVTVDVRRESASSFRSAARTTWISIRRTTKTATIAKTTTTLSASRRRVPRGLIISAPVGSVGLRRRQHAGRSRRGGRVGRGGADESGCTGVARRRLGRLRGGDRRRVDDGGTVGQHVAGRVAAGEQAAAGCGAVAGDRACRGIEEDRVATRHHAESLGVRRQVLRRPEDLDLLRQRLLLALQVAQVALLGGDLVGAV